jgi:hypothetical protein
MTLQLHAPAPLTRCSSVETIKPVVPNTRAASPSMLRHCLAAVTLCRASNVRSLFYSWPARSPKPLCSLFIRTFVSHVTSSLVQVARYTVAHVLAPLNLSWRKLNSDKERSRNICCWRSRTISYFHLHFFRPVCSHHVSYPNLSASPTFLGFRLLD